MRIVHVVPTLQFDRGGPSRSVAGLATAQAQLGHDVVLLAGESDAGTSALAPGVDILTGPILRAPFEVPAPAMFARMREAIVGAEVVHLHSVWNGTISAAEGICRRTRKPFILSPRGMLDAFNVRRRRRLKSWYFCAMERRNIAAAAGLHFLDASERRGCRWFREIRSTPSVVVPNGLDVTGLQAEVAAGQDDPFAGLPGADIKLVFLGRLDPIKNLALQIRILAALRGRGHDARLYLVGPDYGEDAGIRALAGRLGVDDRVALPGPIYDSRRLGLLRSASAVLMTSHYECNSRCAAEAMGVGGLLLATARCHVGTAASFGAALELPPDADAFANAIERLRRDTGLAETIRGRAALFASSHLPWESVARQTLTFYQRVLGGTT